MTADAPEGKTDAPPRRKRRWLRRLVGLGAGGALMLMLGGALAWNHRVRLINRWLEAADWPVRVQVREVDFTRGLVHVRHVDLRGRDGSALGRIEEIRARALPGSIRSKTLESLEVNGLDGEITANAWKALLDPEEPAGAAKSAEKTPWRIKKATLTATRVAWADGAGREVSAAGSVALEDIGVSSSGGFFLGSGALTLENGEFRDGADRHVNLVKTSIQASVNQDSREIILRDWTLAEADVTWLVPPSAGKSDAPHASGEGVAWRIAVEQTDLRAVRFESVISGQRFVGTGDLRGRDFVWDGRAASFGLHALTLTGAEWSRGADRVTLERGQMTAQQDLSGPFHVISGAIAGAHVHVEPGAGPGFSAAGEAAVRELKVEPDGTVRSLERQKVSLREPRMWVQGREPFFTAAAASAEVVPDDLLEKKSVAALAVRQGTLDLTGALFAPTASAPAPAGPGASTDSAPAWSDWSVEALDVPEVAVRAHDLGDRQPDVSAKLALSRVPGAAGYTAALTDIRVLGADPTQPPIAHIARIEATAEAAKLRQRIIDRLEVTGGGFEIGGGLRSLQSPAAPEPHASQAVISPTPPPAAPASPWKIGHAVVKESRVRLVGLLEKLEPVEFDLGLDFTDLPLSEDGLRQRTDRHRVELSKIRVNSVFGGSGVLPVATMNSVFLEFSPAGLLNRRLERVEVLSPVIYVGDPLFWYVEHVRKLAAGEDDDGSTPATVAANAAPPAAPREKPWSIGAVDAHFGQLRFAFKGSELDALPPLPFSCATKLDEGKVDLVLDIPRETWRPSTRMPLEIDVEEGSSVFNLPMATRDNNLVQLFKASEVRYDQFKVRNVYLSTTYDKNGAYAQFGGELYGGYIRGGFDLYADDNMSWDFWIASDGKVDVAPVTHALTPEYLKMTGRAKFDMKAYGDVATGTLYNATGHFSTADGGEMTITGLDPLREKMPDLWSQLQRSLTAAGLTALRDFPFDTCEGDFRLYGKEGDLKLKIQGPRGVRNFEVRSHDRGAGGG